MALDTENAVLVILLSGGTKQTPQYDINKAKRLIRQLKQFWVSKNDH